MNQEERKLEILRLMREAEQDRKVAQAARAQAQAAQAEAASQSAAERRGEAEQGYRSGKTAMEGAPPPIIAIAA